jgi:hypothetical protein
MSININAEENSLVNNGAPYDDKDSTDNAPITNDFLEKFYNHCANMIIDCWKLYKIKKQDKLANQSAQPNCNQKQTPINNNNIANSDERPIPMLVKQTKGVLPQCTYSDNNPYNHLESSNKPDQIDEVAEPIIPNKLIPNIRKQNSVNSLEENKKEVQSGPKVITETKSCKYDDIPLPALAKIPPIAEVDRPLPALKNKDKIPNKLDLDLPQQDDKTIESQENNSKPKKAFLKRTKKYDPKEAIM